MDVIFDEYPGGVFGMYIDMPQLNDNHPYHTYQCAYRGTDTYLHVYFYLDEDATYYWGYTPRNEESVQRTGRGVIGEETWERALFFQSSPSDAEWSAALEVRGARYVAYVFTDDWSPAPTKARALALADGLAKEVDRYYTGP